MENHPSYYAIIPAVVRYCKNLEPNAKLLYGEITALANQQGYCWATNKFFADLYDVEVRSIQNWLESLKELGFIEIETVKEGINWQRRIWISKEVKEMFTKGKNLQEGVQKKSGGGAKNVTANTYNITSSNTENISLSREREEKREIFSEQEELEQAIDPLHMFDVPIDKKSDITDKYSDEQIAQAIAVTQEKCETKNARARWKYFLKVLESPPEKKMTPYDELSQVFKSHEKYNDATCYINEKSISFERGMKHTTLTLAYFHWETFDTICQDFGFKFDRVNKKVEKLP